MWLDFAGAERLFFFLETIGEVENSLENSGTDEVIDYFFC